MLDAKEILGQKRDEEFKSLREELSSLAEKTEDGYMQTCVRLTALEVKIDTFLNKSSLSPKQITTLIAGVTTIAAILTNIAASLITS